MVSSMESIIRINVSPFVIVSEHLKPPILLSLCRGILIVIIVVLKYFGISYIGHYRWCDGCCELFDDVLSKES